MLNHRQKTEITTPIIVCRFNTCAGSTDAVYPISRMAAHQDESKDAFSTFCQTRHGGFSFKNIWGPKSQDAENCHICRPTEQIGDLASTKYSNALWSEDETRFVFVF